ncbi:MAG: hypothetical protein IKF90_07340 [Parasporobacterium sp.]|nr:hypothetical protein [Parasporobacterium sp.]
MNDQPNKNEKKKRSGARPVIAVVGFFVFLFLGAYFLHLFHAMWIIPVTLILAFGWAIFFAMDKEKKKEQNKHDGEKQNKE